MISILDTFKRPATAFAPKTLSDIFALRLAQKLNDEKAVGHYAMLTSEHSECKLLNAYRRTVRETADDDLGRRFHAELEKAAEGSPNGKSCNLLALRIERRCIAAAVFYGDHIEYTQVRQLSSLRDKAVGSTAGFLNWLLDTFPIESAALEDVAEGREIQRGLLTETAADLLRSRMQPMWRIPKAQLLAASGHPPLSSRKELRSLVETIWPILAGTKEKVFIQDAAALGLYVQVERRFIIN